MDSEGLSVAEEKSVSPAPRSGPVIAVIAVLLVAYALATAVGVSEGTFSHGGAHGAEAVGRAISHYWAVIPFTLMLAAIAVLPLLRRTTHWWERNLNKFYVAVNLALLTLLYLTFLHPDGSLGRAQSTLIHTLVQEYVPFIILLFSLYTISGGVRIKGDLRAHALTNSAFLLAGGLLASFVGTTGAAMLLIRPLLETNHERRHVAHTVVFFIFVVCNCGGLLLPLGDPPLFLGYLQGVDFFWTLSLWRSWLLVNGLLIGVYFLWDHFYAYPREEKRDIRRDESRVRGLRFAGLWPNVPLLIGVICSVALLDPAKPLPGTDWHPWFYLREAVQLALVMLSLLLGREDVRRSNSFNYLAIIEVAALFVGIFICMQPALEILNARGAELPLTTPRHYFWASGTLSSVLDNAPTYLVFYNVAKAYTAQALTGPVQTMSGVEVGLLAGVSLGCVFMGSMTYIGNGPNFMVRTIAEHSGVRMPSFFGYMLYSLVILLPILLLNSWLML